MLALMMAPEQSSTTMQKQERYSPLEIFDTLLLQHRNHQNQ
jgi:hypothetical protein